MSRYFVRNQQRALAEVVAARKGHLLPPLLNELSLFTRAAPFGDTADMYYHSPSDKIGSNYSKTAEQRPEDASKQFSSPRKLAEASLSASLTGNRLKVLDALSLADQADVINGLPDSFTDAQRAVLADAIVRYYYYIEVRAFALSPHPNSPTLRSPAVPRPRCHLIGCRSKRDGAERRGARRV